MASRYAVLGKKTDWVAADLNSAATRWVGPDGSGGFAYSTTEASVNLFDFRKFKHVQLVWDGTFANAVTLTISIGPCFEAAQSSTGVFTGTTLGYNAPFATTVVSGGPAVCLTGTNVNTANTGTEATFQGQKTWTPFHPLYGRVKLFPSAATGTITGGKLYLIGIY